MPQLRPWKGTALITGGAKRIGKGIALHLAANGYRIALHYHQSHDMAQKTAAAIRRRKGRCEVFACDLADEQQTQSLIPTVLKEFPDLNLLINNASVFEKSGLTKGSITSLNHHFAINLKAPYILTCELARVCRLREGHIINILDTKIVKNKSAYVAYLLSKKSLYDLTKLSAVELAPHIRVNGVSPGLIYAPVNEKATYLTRLAKHIPLKRKGSLKHITQAIQFLLANDYVTGQIIFVDGGEHLL